MKDWELGSPKDDWVSMAIPSDGSYGVPEGIIFGYPLRSSNEGKIEIVQGLEINEFAKAKIEITTEELLNENSFEFCWIVDFPMYELDEKNNKIQFSHNPFSMPQGDLIKLDFSKPLDIKAYQYLSLIHI